MSALPPTGRRTPAVTGVRLAAVCVLLVGLALVQDPGFLVPDTKFDLVLDPAHFLGRSLHLWDADGAFGRVQNQAYGYLWPMGPFFLLGHVVDVPGWVVQRLWLGLLLCTSFLGSARVSRALGVRSDVACILAGLAYALSPRMLSTLGPISIEAWPSALAPWVLLPLVRGSVTGSPRRAAALSALAVAMVGGVNAAATFAVLPLGVVFLLTRTRGPRRRALMLWWPLFTALGTLWWLVPLFLLGSYSPPFLDYIESASITTFPTTLFDAVRGTSHWVPYIDSGWRAGNDLITRFYLPLNSGVVLMLGFVGLMHPRNPHRQFLALSVLLGLLMVTMGHLGNVHGWFASDVHGLLDGALAPLRNVHKFDPVVRLPLVVGLAWLMEESAGRLAIARRSRRGEGSWPRTLVAANHAAVLALAVAVLAGAAAPALAGRLTPGGATLAVPDYWRDAARWLARSSGPDVALLVPGSSGSYVWGSPRDEPLQSLARSRWAVRDGIPLTPPGNIRMLDAIESRLGQGAGSPGLADYLRRAGVRYLVVRNDLVHGDDVPDPVLVHQALSRTPGVRLVRAFGPEVGGDAHLRRGDARVLVNDGWQARHPAVEVYEVPGPAATAVTTTEAPVVVGGPEDLLDLADLGLLGDQPTRLAVDGGRTTDAGAPLVLTDGLRAREQFFGRIHDATSAVLTPGDIRRSGNPTRDYTLGEGDRWSTTVRLGGVRSVSASSSMSDAGALGGAVPGDLPFAALDGSADTAWVSGRGQDEPGWWRVGLERATEVAAVRLVGGANAPDAQEVRVRTARGASRATPLGPGEQRSVRVPAGSTTWVRVEDASGGRPQVSLAEVSVPGVEATRSLVLPRLPHGSPAPDAVVLRAARDARTGCAQVGVDVRCVPGRDRPSEETSGMSRVVRLPASATYEPTLSVVPRPGEALETLLERRQPFQVTASSRAVDDVRASAYAAVDGDPGTTWTAAVGDLRPSLDLRWLGKRSVRGLALSVDRDAAARRPDRVVLSWPGGRRTVRLDARGRARFAPIRTDRLTLRVDTAEEVSSLGFDRVVAPVGVGVSEVRLRGVPYFPAGLPSTPVRYPCGTGPDVTVDGHRRPTSVTALPADLVAMRPVAARVCGHRTVDLHAGENAVDVASSAAFAPASLVLRRPGDTGLPVSAAATSAAALKAMSPERRTVRVPTGDRLLSLRENVNPGWRAELAGHALRPVTVDGWQQGFELTGRAGTLRESYAPDGTYRVGLGVGLVLLVALVALAAVPGRRWPGSALPPLRARELRSGVMLGVAVLGAGLLAGWGGVLVALPAAALALLLRRFVPEVSWWGLGGACLVASLAYVLRPWGSPSGWAGNLTWPHYLVLVSVVGTLVLSSEWSPRRPRVRSRIAGSSTNR
ncbi:MAG TPA: alpha-(1-_3)-arabinofuranosyltransferase family protein [Nocardioidaceae bacterium]|nr:alpha-(1->3)-arabinofuranosyltransferase family protein [Nocardioidaceae bacterium]